MNVSGGDVTPSIEDLVEQFSVCYVRLAPEELKMKKTIVVWGLPGPQSTSVCMALLGTHFMLNFHIFKTRVKRQLAVGRRGSPVSLKHVPAPNTCTRLGFFERTSEPYVSERFITTKIDAEFNAEKDGFIHFVLGRF
eukprot:sb/3474559/